MAVGVNGHDKARREIDKKNIPGIEPANQSVERPMFGEYEIGKLKKARQEREDTGEDVAVKSGFPDWYVDIILLDF